MKWGGYILSFDDQPQFTELSVRIILSASWCSFSFLYDQRKRACCKNAVIVRRRRYENVLKLKKKRIKKGRITFGPLEKRFSVGRLLHGYLFAPFRLRKKGRGGAP